MAHRLDISAQDRNVPFLWTISQTVGDDQSCANAADDVRLLKILIFEWLRVDQPAIHQSCRAPFANLDQMDVTLAYWIRALQHLTMAQSSSFRDMGIISPARGARYAPNRRWSIYVLNKKLKDSSPTAWRNLPDHRSMSASLRQALQR